MKLIRSTLFVFSVLLGSGHAIAGVVDNEVIILLDSSGSVIDTGYGRWNAMLELAEDIVTETGSGNAHGVGIFSGCRAIFSLQDCADTGFLSMNYGLHDGAIDPFTGDPITGDQTPGAVSGYLASLDSTDFLGGFSWVDEALTMALQSFVSSSNTVLGERHLFFLTDGRPPTSGHSPVDGFGFESDTLQGLRSLGVNIHAIEFSADPDVDYLNALTNDPNNVYAAESFTGAGGIVTSVTPVPGPMTLIVLVMGLVGLFGRQIARKTES